MNKFSVNGVERESPLSDEAALGDLLSFIRQTYNSDQALISAIHVDGLELRPDEELELRTIPVSQLGPIEVFTSHPREVAEETLQALKEFSLNLAELSRATAEIVGLTEFQPKLRALIEGIGTFMEALVTVRQILRIGLLEPVNFLEADLASILKDIVDCIEHPNPAYLQDLMKVHLPANLDEWREKAIPELIRSRDS
jgi:hypothetical protein